MKLKTLFKNGNYINNFHFIFAFKGIFVVLWGNQYILQMVIYENTKDINFFKFICYGNNIYEFFNF